MSFSQSIRGLSAPDPADAQEGKDLIVKRVQVTFPSVSYTTPRQILNDGTHIFVGQSNQPPSSSPVVHKLTVSGGTVTDAKTLDLSVSNPSVVTVRDLSQYNAGQFRWLFAATFNANHVAIIDKVTMTVIGWANTTAYGPAYSVAIDTGGNLYVAIGNTGHIVLKFTTASLIGQPPNNGVAPIATCPTSGQVRSIRFGGGKLWVTNGGAGVGPVLYKIDPSAMTIDTSAPDLNGDTSILQVVYAFGAVWATSNNSNGVYKVDPNNLAVLNTLPPVAPFTGQAGGIEVGPDNVGGSFTRLYVTSENNNFVGIIDPTGPTWLSTITGPTVGAHYEGITAIGNFAYFASYAPGTPTIDWVNQTAATSGALVAAAPTFKPSLGYVDPPGGTIGPVKTHADSPYTVPSTEAITRVDLSGGDLTVKFPASPTVGETHAFMEVSTSGGGSLTIDGNSGSPNIAKSGNGVLISTFVFPSGTGGGANNGYSWSNWIYNGIAWVAKELTAGIDAP